MVGFGISYTGLAPKLFSPAPIERGECQQVEKFIATHSTTAPKKAGRLQLKILSAKTQQQALILRMIKKSFEQTLIATVPTTPKQAARPQVQILSAETQQQQMISMTINEEKINERIITFADSDDLRGVADEAKIIGPGERIKGVFDTLLVGALDVCDGIELLIQSCGR